MNNITRIRSTGRMSQAVIHDDRVYLAGQVANDTDADITGQTRQILDKVEGLLVEAGSDKTKMLSAMIWLPDISTYDEFNAVWDSWLPVGHAPARACVESRLAGVQYLVEISIVAARDSISERPLLC